MGGYKTFGEFLERRDAATGSPAGYDLKEPVAARDDGHVVERSVCGKLFRSPFKAESPARPVLPTNSRLLASPLRKQRLRSQVIGR